MPGLPRPAFPNQAGVSAVTKILVLYCSSHGHIETMANAVAKGVRDARFLGRQVAQVAVKLAA